MKRMDGLKSALIVEKQSIEEDLILDWSDLQPRRVFSLEYGSGLDIQKRFVINRALRESTVATQVKTEVLQDRVPTAVIPDRGDAVPRVLMEEISLVIKDRLAEIVAAIAKVDARRKELLLQRGRNPVDLELANEDKINMDSLRLLRAQKADLTDQLSWVNKSLQYVGPLAPATFATATVGDSKLTAYENSPFVPFPRLRTGQQGVIIKIRATSVLSDATRQYLLEKLFTKVKKGGKNKFSDLCILAPPECLNEKGELQPLPKEVEDGLITFTRTRKAPPGFPLEPSRAWQWLIISHNANRFGKDPVPLAKPLVVQYNQPVSAEAKYLQRISQLENTVQRLLSQMETFKSQTVFHDERKIAFDALQDTLQAVATPPPSSPTETEVEYVGFEKPKTVVKGSRTYIRVTMDEFLSRPANNPFSVFLSEEDEGGFGVYAEDLTTRPVSPHRDEVTKPSVRVEPKVKTPKTTVHSDNPLRVSGEPRTKGIPETSLTELRKFFKIEESSLPPEQWAAMSKTDKTEFRRKRSLPRWALEVLRKDSGLLPKILSGEINVTNHVGFLRGRTPSAVANGKQSEAAKAWTALKGSFAGVPLLAAPRNRREQSLRRQFDALVSKYGDQPCFPKPRVTQGPAPGWSRPWQPRGYAYPYQPPHQMWGGYNPYGPYPPPPMGW
jgi:hypothetical protein